MPKPLKFIIGSRGSQLALRQTEWVKNELQKKFSFLKINIQVIKTAGDKILNSSLSKVRDRGIFTKEIEHALLERQIDLAVHSLKDLPTQLPEGLMIGAITKREDIRDVFVAHPKKSCQHITELPPNATIATGSLRRKCQLLHFRHDLNIIDLRGNLNTRLKKLDTSDWDGIILARAGMLRLGLEGRIIEILPIDMILPAVGQGALAIEIRSEDKTLHHYLQSIASEATTLATTGERSFLRFLEGGCQVPIASFARIKNNGFIMDAMIGSLEGDKIVRGRILGLPTNAEELGQQLAQTLLNSGGEEILNQIRKSTVEISPT